MYMYLVLFIYWQKHSTIDRYVLSTFSNRFPFILSIQIAIKYVKISVLTDLLQLMCEDIHHYIVTWKHRWICNILLEIMGFALPYLLYFSFQVHNTPYKTYWEADYGEVSVVCWYSRNTVSLFQYYYSRPQWQHPGSNFSLALPQKTTKF